MRNLKRIILAKLLVWVSRDVLYRIICFNFIEMSSTHGRNRRYFILRNRWKNVISNFLGDAIESGKIVPSSNCNLEKCKYYFLFFTFYVIKIIRLLLLLLFTIDKNTFYHQLNATKFTIRLYNNQQKRRQ